MQQFYEDAMDSLLLTYADVKTQVYSIYNIPNFLLHLRHMDTFLSHVQQDRQYMILTRVFLVILIFSISSL